MEEKKSIHCTLTDHELAAKADQWIDELIASGGKSFTMQVPARPNADPDLIFAELNNRFKKMVAGQHRAVWPLFVIDKATGERHEVNKVVYHPDNEPEPHVWCDTWYGHHIIGKDCEWAVPLQPGAVWVKASANDIKEGEYISKYRKSPGDVWRIGVTVVDLTHIHFIEKESYNFRLIKGHEELDNILLLDESGSPAAGREEDAVEFAEWAGWDWRRVEGKSMWENQKTLEVLSSAKLYKKYKTETGR